MCRYINCVILIKGENMVEFDGNVSSSRGNVPSSGEGYGSEPLTEKIAKKILIDFKKKDTDSSMRVSFDELSNAIIKEYVDNGYKRTDPHKPGETITDLLHYYQERAKEFDANGDGALNIDEYTAMFREKFEEAEREAAARADSKDDKNRNIGQPKVEKHGNPTPPDVPQSVSEQKDVQPETISNSIGELNKKSGQNFINKFIE